MEKLIGKRLNALAGIYGFGPKHKGILVFNGYGLNALAGIYGFGRGHIR